MIKWIVRWFFFKWVELKRKKLIKRKAPSFEKNFRNRVRYLAKKFNLQFGGKVATSFGGDNAYIFRDNLVIAEITIFRKGESASSTYIVVRTNVEPLPQWWLKLAFVGMKWNVTRFPIMSQLTYEKPRE